MTKFRSPHTPEYALQRAFALLKDAGHKGPEVLAASIKKSPDLIYKWADPDEDAQLPVWAAIQFDKVCLRLCKQAPFADFMQGLAEIADPQQQSKSISGNMMQLQAHLGELAATVVKATSSDSEAGEGIGRAELQLLMPALDHSRGTLNAIEQSIIAAAESRKKRAGPKPAARSSGEDVRSITAT